MIKITAKKSSCYSDQEIVDINIPAGGYRIFHNDIFIVLYSVSMTTYNTLQKNLKNIFKLVFRSYILLLIL